MVRCETPMRNGVGIVAHLHRIGPRCNPQRERKRWCRGEISPTWLWTIRMRGEFCHDLGLVRRFDAGGYVAGLFFCGGLAACAPSPKHRFFKVCPCALPAASAAVLAAWPLSSTPTAGGSSSTVAACLCAVGPCEWTHVVGHSTACLVAIGQEVGTMKEHNEVTIVTHEGQDVGDWFEVRWQGRTEEVFSRDEAQDAAAYAVALQANGGPLFDEDGDWR